MNNFEVSIRVDEDFVGVETDKGTELAECIGAGLKYAPELSFLKVFILFLSGIDFFFKGDLWKFKHGIYFVGSGAEATKNSGLNFDRIEYIFFRSFIDELFKLYFFIFEQKLTSKGILFE